MKRSAVFLDRDGVINRAFVRDGIPHPPSSLEELTILPNVNEALRTLKAHGYVLVVVTNQPDVARGVTSRQSVDGIHERLMIDLDLDAILTCFHDDVDACDCRKPKPGLLLRAAHEFGIDLKSSFMVGDRWRDMDAGRAAGCRTLLVARHCAEKAADHCDFRVRDLAAAAHLILAQPAS